MLLASPAPGKAEKPRGTPLRSIPIVKMANGYRVEGLADVEARPHRMMHEARQLAERIRADADSYLATVRQFNVPGVTDLRQPGHHHRCPTCGVGFWFSSALAVHQLGNCAAVVVDQQAKGKGARHVA